MLLLNKLVTDFFSEPLFNFNACNVIKAKLPFGVSSLSSNCPLELIYTEVWGPIILSIDNFKYYVVFLDHFTRYIWLYPIKHKCDLQVIFSQFKAIIVITGTY